MKGGTTHAITSADGPSRAGPISERVVKPDALQDVSISKSIYRQLLRRTLDQDQQHTKPGQAWKGKQACSFYLQPCLILLPMHNGRFVKPVWLVTMGKYDEVARDLPTSSRRK